MRKGDSVCEIWYSACLSGVMKPSATAPYFPTDTLSTLIGIAILLIGVGYLLALCGINRFEKNVKEFGKAINGAE